MRPRRPLSPLSPLSPLALLALLTSCDLGLGEDARLRVLHDVRGVANIEVWIDDEFKLEITPSELSQDLNLAAGGHALSLRFTGGAEELLAHDITLSERVNLLVLGGEGREIAVTEVNRPLPDVSLDEHALEVVNLAGDLSFELSLSNQTPPAGGSCPDEAARCPRAVLALPQTSADDDVEVSEFLRVTPGATVNISTDHLPRGDSDFVDDDLLGGETSTLLIRAVGGAEDRPTLRLQLLRALP